jgi:hypothetical protein
MKKFELEIEQAKKEIIEAKKRAWISEHIDTKSRFNPVIPNIQVKAWFTAVWETGFIVMDYEELIKLPKKRREKILTLGGIR